MENGLGTAEAAQLADGVGSSGPFRRLGPAAWIRRPPALRLLAC